MHDLAAARALPIEFAIPAEAGVAFLVDQVDAGPVAVAIAVPVSLVVIDSYRMGQLGVAEFFLQQLNSMFGIRFRSMNADQR